MSKCVVYLFCAIYSMIFVVLTDELSIIKAVLIIPTGIFVTLALNEYLKSKETDV